MASKKTETAGEEFGETLTPALNLPAPTNTFLPPMPLVLIRLSSALLFGLALGILGFLSGRLVIGRFQPAQPALFDDGYVPVRANAFDLGRLAQPANSTSQNEYRRLQDSQTTELLQPTRQNIQSPLSASGIQFTLPAKLYQGSAGTAASIRPDGSH